MSVEGHNENTTKRVQVSFTREQWALLELLRGELGGSDSDIVRNVVIAWLAEKSFISDAVKFNIRKRREASFND